MDQAGAPEQQLVSLLPKSQLDIPRPVCHSKIDKAWDKFPNNQ